MQKTTQALFLEIYQQVLSPVFGRAPDFCGSVNRLLRSEKPDVGNTEFGEGMLEFGAVAKPATWWHPPLPSPRRGGWIKRSVIHGMTMSKKATKTRTQKVAHGDLGAGRNIDQPIAILIAVPHSARSILLKTAQISSDSEQLSWRNPEVAGGSGGCWG